MGTGYESYSACWRILDLSNQKDALISFGSSFCFSIDLKTNIEKEVKKVPHLNYISTQYIRVFLIGVQYLKCYIIATSSFLMKNSVFFKLTTYFFTLSIQKSSDFEKGKSSIWRQR